MTKAEKTKYIKSIAVTINEVAKAHGYKVTAPVIAHAVLCSGEGESPLLAHNNIFGLKCSATWSGDVVNKDTIKIYKPKKNTVVTLDYRAYKTVEQCIDGYFIYLDSYLPQLKTAKTYKSAAKMLENYTNKGKYAIMILDTIEAYKLEKYEK